MTHATPEATRALAAEHLPGAPHGYTLLGGTGLTVSRVGFGCYRVDDVTPEHREALEVALAAGCNLIDTSTNYTDGGSERLVGEVLRQASRGGRPGRESVVVVSKIGYVQGQNLEVALAREHAGTPFQEMVKYMDGCWHCIHPDFLRDQLARSRERLQLDTLDVCLLHNPEYFFSDAKKRRSGDLEARRTEFYRRVREAFAFFEDAARRGEIRWYGVSSNTAVSPAGDPESTSVSLMLAAAQEAGGRDHRFRVLQFPMNLLEPGGALTRNTGTDGKASPLEASAAAGLGVLVNRPLNAIVGNRLSRLAEVETGTGESRIADHLKTLGTLRTEYREQIAPRREDTGGAAEEFFGLIDQIAELPDQIEDLDHWRQIEQQYIIPRINHTARALGQAVAGDLPAQWQGWWGRCLPALEGLLEGLGRKAAERSLTRIASIRGSIDPAIPPERRGERLSRKALWVLASTPGVSTVLVGMRRAAYVKDAMGILAWSPLPEPLEIYSRLQRRGR
jgi:uncharacterized protein